MSARKEKDENEKKDYFSHIFFICPPSFRSSIDGEYLGIVCRSELCRRRLRCIVLFFSSTVISALVVVRYSRTFCFDVVCVLCTSESSWLEIIAAHSKKMHCRNICSAIKRRKRIRMNKNSSNNKSGSDSKKKRQILRIRGEIHLSLLPIGKCGTFLLLVFCLLGNVLVPVYLWKPYYMANGSNPGGPYLNLGVTTLTNVFSSIR